MYIAILQADPLISTQLRKLLRQAGHTTQVFDNGATLVNALAADPPDMYVLDWWAPGRTGLQVLYHIRQHCRLQTPVLFLAPSGNERDIACALDAGANDYCTKPVHAALFLTRAAGLLRKPPQAAQQGRTPQCLGYRFEPMDLRVHFEGTAQPLSDKEFRLALYLFENAGVAIARKRLILAVWGQESSGTSRCLDVHICAIRKKLHVAPDAPHIRLKSIYGFGYLLYAVPP